MGWTGYVISSESESESHVLYLAAVLSRFLPIAVNGEVNG